jgi:hypothetical protein
VYQINSYKLSFFDESLIAKFFSRELFSMLLHERLINLELVQKILRWRHTGFNVHTKVRTTTKREAERVGKYMIRPLLSLKRLFIDKAEGKVCYQYGKDSSELERMDYLEFIARVSSHIPDKGQVMIRYYGLYANAHRGKMSKDCFKNYCWLSFALTSRFRLIPSSSACMARLR